MSRRLTLLLALLALVGYWAPWLAHPAAGLNFNGFELSEWVTFLPAVRLGSLAFAYWRLPFTAIYFARLAFFIPLTCVAWLLCLAATQPAPPPAFIPPGAPTIGNPAPPASQKPNRSGQWLLIALALGCALAIIPPYPDILTVFTDTLNSEFTAQFALAGLALLGCGVMVFLPTTLKDLLQIGLSALALGMVGWAMQALDPEARALLPATWSLGWGFWLLLLSLGGLALLGLRQLFAPR